MSTVVCRGCELRELPQPPQEGEMPVEQCCFQMRKSYSKGWGNTCWTRQRGCFQQGMAAKGLFTSRGGSWEGGCTAVTGAGSWEQGTGSWEHPSSFIPWCSQPRTPGLGTEYHCSQSRARTRPLPHWHPCRVAHGSVSSSGPFTSRNKSHWSRGWGCTRSLKSCRTFLWKQHTKAHPCEPP